ncbi:unnamed protein product [Oreochromis niloticus]|nr:unnamed protein product [Mustela putorius furo]
MERLGIVQRSNSAWASPLHMAPISDGRWRPCGDFRRLNNATENDRYPMPHIQDFSANLAGTSIFSKIDLVRGYHQVPVSDLWSARQQRQLAAISEFTTDIQHVAGKSNHVADCLSHVLVSPVYVGVDYAAMAAEQRADLDVLALQSTKMGLALEDTPVWDGGPHLLCDVSTGRPRPVVPLSWRCRVFDSVHALSHPGVRASVKLVSARFVWPGLRKTVKEWAAASIPCQHSKIHRHTQAPLEPFRVPVICLDALLGPVYFS